MPDRKRKSMSGAVQGMNAFFSGPVTDASEAAEDQDQSSEEELERVTLYLRPDQDSFLTELLSKLKRKRVKTNRSELVRAAIDALSKHDLESIEEIVQNTKRYSA
jgi:hypothetical protein